MMREIVFRGKRADNGEWVEGFLLKECNHSTCSWNLAIEYKTKRSGVFAYDVVDIIPETVGQFILTDKNSKKIFEGDIVKLFLDDGIAMGVIRYSENAYRFMFYEDNVYGYGFDNTCVFEVIGNIYDNPELLEGNNNAE